MKIKNLKLKKRLIAMLTTGSIVLTGTATVHANTDLLDEILTAVDGYETTHHYGDLPTQSEIEQLYQRQNAETEETEVVEEVVEEPIVVTPTPTPVVVEEQIPVEEPVEEDPTVDTEAETISSDLLTLMDSESNKAVLDFFDEADRELNQYTRDNDVEGLIPVAQTRVAQGIDFLFFGGTISNHTKEELNEDGLKLFIEQLNNYVNSVKSISADIIGNMDPKYDDATYYINTDNIGQFDEIGVNIINKYAVQETVEEPVVEEPVEEENVEAEIEETVEEVVEEPVEEIVEVSEEAETAVNDYFASIEEVLVDYINNGDFEGLVVNAQDTVKLAMDFLFFEGSIEGYTKYQVGRQTLEDTVFRINNYIEVVEELSPGFLTNMDPKYNECTIYLSNEFIDDYDSIGAEIAADPVDEADETYTLR